MNKITLSFFDPNTKVDFHITISRQTINSCEFYKYYYNNPNADWQIVGIGLDNIDAILKEDNAYLQQESRN